MPWFLLKEYNNNLFELFCSYWNPLQVGEVNSRMVGDPDFHLPHHQPVRIMSTSWSCPLWNITIELLTTPSRLGHSFEGIASLVAQWVKNLPAMQEIWVQFLGQEDPLEKEMATYSSILAWKIPWTEKPGRLQSMESQSIRQDWVCVGMRARAHTHTHTHTHNSETTLKFVISLIPD